MGTLEPLVSESCCGALCPFYEVTDPHGWSLPFPESYSRTRRVPDLAYGVASVGRGLGWAGETGTQCKEKGLFTSSCDTQNDGKGGSLSVGRKPGSAWTFQRMIPSLPPEVLSEAANGKRTGLRLEFGLWIELVPQKIIN